MARRALERPDAASRRGDAAEAPWAGAARALVSGGAALAEAALRAASRLAAARSGAAARRRSGSGGRRGGGPPFASLSARLVADRAPARLNARAPPAQPRPLFDLAAAPADGAAAVSNALQAVTPASARAAAAAAAAAASEGGEGGDAPGAPPAAPPREERILISEVEIKGVTGELAALAQAALTIKPNFAYTLEEVQEDVNRVFQTGYFSNCQPLAEDTRDGVRVTLDVRPNPELKGVVVNGANALPVRVIQDAFAAQARHATHHAQARAASPLRAGLRLGRLSPCEGLSRARPAARA